MNHFIERMSLFPFRTRSICILFCLCWFFSGFSNTVFGYVGGSHSESITNLTPRNTLNDTLEVVPKEVMMKSLLVPGWGQIQNRQAWKVPIIYGALAGGGVYLSDLTKRYHDYRAAVYNISRGSESDFRYGDTPSYIPENANLTELQRLRDSYRNKRDFAFILIGILYGLNVLDAYVYAHMSSFDVSDDLSASVSFIPMDIPAPVSHEISVSMITPGIRVRIALR